MKKKIEWVDVADLVTDHPFLALFNIKANDQLVANVQRRNRVEAVPLVVKFNGKMIVCYDVKQVLAAIKNGMERIEVLIIERSNEAEIMAFIADDISYSRTETYQQGYKIISHLRKYFDQETEESNLFYEWCVGKDVDEKIASILDRSKTWVYNIRTVGDWDLDYLIKLDERNPGYSIDAGVKLAGKMLKQLEEYPFTQKQMEQVQETVKQILSQLSTGLKSNVGVLDKNESGFVLEILSEPIRVQLRLLWEVGEKWGEYDIETSYALNTPVAENELVTA